MRLSCSSCLPRLGAVLLAGLMAAAQAGAPTAPEPLSGESLYRNGLLPSGQPLWGA